MALEFQDILNQRSGLEYFEMVLRYVASGADQIREEEIESGVKKNLREKGGHIMETLNHHDTRVHMPHHSKE